MLLIFFRWAQAQTRVSGRLFDVKHYKTTLSRTYLTELRMTAMFALLTAKKFNKLNKKSFHENKSRYSKVMKGKEAR
jgi:hypothetical protein